MERPTSNMAVSAIAPLIIYKLIRPLLIKRYVQNIKNTKNPNTAVFNQTKIKRCVGLFCKIILLFCFSSAISFDLFSICHSEPLAKNPMVIREILHCVQDYNLNKPRKKRTSFSNFLFFKNILYFFRSIGQEGLK